MHALRSCPYRASPVTSPSRHEGATRPSARSLASVLAVLVLKGLGVALSVAISVAIAGLFGATSVTDAFFLARRVVMNVAAVLERSVQLVMVPPLVRIAEQEGIAGLHRMLARNTRRLLLLAAVAVAAAFVLAPQIVGLVAPGFDEARRAAAVLYFRVFVVTLPISAYAALSGAMFNAVRRFVLPVSARLLPRLFSLAALGVLAATPLALGMNLVAWAVAAGVVTMGAVFAIASRRLFASPGPVAAIRTARTPAPVSGGRLVALVLGQVHMLASSWIDMGFASLTAPGNVAILEFAQRLVNIGPGAAIGSVMVVYYTEFASALSAGDSARFRRHLVEALRMTVFMVLPVGVALFFLSQDLVAVLFARGAFAPEAAQMTARIVSLLAPLVVVNALVSAFFAAILAEPHMSHLRVLGAALAGSILVRAGLDLALIDRIGLLAVPIASLASSLVPLVLIYGALAGRTGRLLRKGDIAPFLAIAGAGAVMALAMTAVMASGGAWSERGVGQAVMVAVAAIAGLGAYLGVAFALRLPETEVVRDALRRRMGGRQG